MNYPLSPDFPERNSCIVIICKDDDPYAQQAQDCATNHGQWKVIATTKEMKEERRIRDAYVLDLMENNPHLTDDESHQKCLEKFGHCVLLVVDGVNPDRDILSASEIMHVGHRFAMCAVVMAGEKKDGEDVFSLVANSRKMFGFSLRNSLVLTARDVVKLSQRD